MSQFANLPLQEMIRSVVVNATEKLASDEGAEAQVRSALGDPQFEDDGEEYSEEDLVVDPNYVEKLAEACDFIAYNVEAIEPPSRGILGNAIAKMAGESVPPAVTTPEQLDVQAAMAGKQQYKHDKPKTNDSAVSQADTPLSAANIPGGGRTQLDNNMHDAPGPQSGITPTSEYPAAGPLHAGPTKTASLAEIANYLAEEKTAASAEFIGPQISRARRMWLGVSQPVKRKAKAVGEATRRGAKRVDTAATMGGHGMAHMVGKNVGQGTARALGYGVPAAALAGAGGAGYALGKEAAGMPAGGPLISNLPFMTRARGAGKAVSDAARGAGRRVDTTATMGGHGMAHALGKNVSPGVAKALGYGVPAAALAGAGGAGYAMGKDAGIGSAISGAARGAAKSVDDAAQTGGMAAANIMGLKGPASAAKLRALGYGIPAGLAASGAGAGYALGKEATGGIFTRAGQKAKDVGRAVKDKAVYIDRNIMGAGQFIGRTSSPAAGRAIGYGIPTGLAAAGAGAGYAASKKAGIGDVARKGVDSVKGFGRRTDEAAQGMGRLMAGGRGGGMSPAAARALGYGVPVAGLAAAGGAGYAASKEAGIGDTARKGVEAVKGFGRRTDQTAQGMGRLMAGGRGGGMSPAAARALGYGVPAAGLAAAGGTGYALSKDAGAVTEAFKRFGGRVKDVGANLDINAQRLGSMPKYLATGGDVSSQAARRAIGYGMGASALGAAGLTGAAISKNASAAEVAREMILRKLAGEDVMKASTTTPTSGGPLVGDGVMDAHQAEQVPSNPTDGSGYGNQQRGHVQGNQAAIDYTKADAKKPRVPELKEVLKQPAFNPAHDSKLREQLRNAGSAGVKIAGATHREFLKQASASGLLNQETVNQFRELRKQASAEREADDKVDELRAAFRAKKDKESMVGGQGYASNPPPAGM